MAIVKDPGICGGRARINGTRIPVWGIIKAVKAGLGIQSISKEYPGISADGLLDCTFYYLNNTEEIDRDIEENEVVVASECIDYGEPWRIFYLDATIYPSDPVIIANDGCLVVNDVSGGAPLKRICECVNACRGMVNPEGRVAELIKKEADADRLIDELMTVETLTDLKAGRFIKKVLSEANCRRVGNG